MVSGDFKNFEVQGNSGRIQVYEWPCGCKAAGKSIFDLTVGLCDLHKTRTSREIKA
jgi:hypothetical protein